MQCASGKKAAELEVMGRKEMNIRDIVVEKASPMDILKNPTPGGLRPIDCLGPS